MTKQPTTPISTAVALSLAGVFLVIVSAAAILGSYALALHAVHQAEANTRTLQAREATSQTRAAIPTCKALAAIDKDAERILALPAAAKATPAVISFFQDFPKVYTSTDCAAVFKYARDHGIK